jgi:uncharacterized Tic20 family protein
MTDSNLQPASPGPASEPAAPLTAAEDKQWAAFAHFGGILWLLPSLIIYLVFKDRGTLTRQESKEALNWQITWILASVASWIIGGITMFIGIGFLFLVVIPWALYLTNVVLSILGGVRVNSDGTYRYPFSIRLIK